MEKISSEEGWQGRSVYQVYPNTFNEVRPEGAEHIGRGSILGIVEKLDYLNELGIKAIWISPFYESPLKDGGYDISNATNVDPSLGSLEDIDLLLKSSHERDIRVLFDLVPNHTSDQHEWFRQSCEDPEGEHGETYIWADPKPRLPGDPALPLNIVAGDRLNGMPSHYTVPNNWSSIFSIPEREKLKDQYGGTIPDDVEVPARTAWVWHTGRQQFYLAEFTKEQPSLNWNNPAVRENIKNVMRFWLDKGVDGFRVDVMNHIGKDPTLTDEQFVSADQYDKNRDNPHDQWEQKRLVSYAPLLDTYARELIEVLDEYPEIDGRLVLEDWITALSDAPNSLSRIRPDRATVFNFERLLHTNRNDWAASAHKALLDTYYESFEDPALAGSIPNQVDSNHDVDRVATRLGREAALVAAVIKLCLPGTPYIYQGEEGGLGNIPDAFIPPERRKDSDLGLRDGERTPIPWNNSKNNGFSNADPTHLWLPGTDIHKRWNLEDQAKDARSPYWLFRALLQTRNSSPELLKGAYLPLRTDHHNVLAFGRALPQERTQYTVLANFSAETTRVAAIDTRYNLGRVVLSSIQGHASQRIDEEVRLHDNPVILNPNEALLLRSS